MKHRVSRLQDAPRATDDRWLSKPGASLLASLAHSTPRFCGAYCDHHPSSIPSQKTRRKTGTMQTCAGRQSDVVTALPQLPLRRKHIRSPVELLQQVEEDRSVRQSDADLFSLPGLLVVLVLDQHPRHLGKQKKPSTVGKNADQTRRKRKRECRYPPPYQPGEEPSRSPNPLFNLVVPQVVERMCTIKMNETEATPRPPNEKTQT